MNSELGCFPAAWCTRGFYGFPAYRTFNELSESAPKPPHLIEVYAKAPVTQKKTVGTGAVGNPHGISVKVPLESSVFADAIVLAQLPHIMNVPRLSQQD